MHIWQKFLQWQIFCSKHLLIALELKQLSINGSWMEVAISKADEEYFFGQQKWEEKSVLHRKTAGMGKGAFFVNTSLRISTIHNWK